MPILPMISTAAGAALGLGLDSIKREQQIKQSKRLQNVQIKGQKEMADYNNNLAKQTAMEIWEKTNYGAQRKQMEKAGLNAGLMYGGAGAGATTQTPSTGGSVGGQAAYVSDGMGLQLGQQIAMQAAQIELIKAQTEKTKVEATKTAGVDTEGVTLDNKLKEIQTKINNATEYYQVEKSIAESTHAAINAEIRAKESGILSATWHDQVDTIKKEAILKGVEIKAKEAGINLTNEQIKETAEKINRIVAEVARMEAQTEQGREALLLDRMQKEFNTSAPAQIKQWTDIGTDILKASKTIEINNKNAAKK